MNNQDAPAPQPTRNLPVTASESRMLGLLRTNPLLARQISSLVGRFGEEVAGGLDANQAEEMAIEEVGALGKTIIQQWAENTHDEEIARAKRDDPSLTESGTKILRWYTTFGQVSINEQVLRMGRRGATSRVFKQVANIGGHRCSRPLQRRIADFGSERSGRASVAALAEHYAIEVPLYTVDAVTRDVAREAYVFNLERPPGKVAAAVQVTELDGSMLPIVGFKDAAEVSDPAAKADKRKRRTCQWNEIRVCSTHDPKRAAARDGVSFGGVLETGLMMAETCKQSGMDPATRIHGVGDGATWIADQFEKQFGTQGCYLLDFYHACEYLGEAAEGCPGGGTPAGKKRWMEKQKKRLKENRYEEVIGELESHREGEEVAEKEAPVRRCWRYLGNRKDQLDYQGAIEAGLPIGSGEVESTHRHLLQRRLKIPGAWWKKETVADMAQLRVMRANEEWRTFWQEKAA